MVGGYASAATMLEIPLASGRVLSNASEHDTNEATHIPAPAYGPNDIQVDARSTIAPAPVRLVKSPRLAIIVTEPTVIRNFQYNLHGSNAFVARETAELTIGVSVRPDIGRQ